MSHKPFDYLMEAVFSPGMQTSPWKEQILISALFPVLGEYLAYNRYSISIMEQKKEQTNPPQERCIDTPTQTHTKYSFACTMSRFHEVSPAALSFRRFTLKRFQPGKALLHNFFNFSVCGF